MFILLNQKNRNIILVLASPGNRGLRRLSKVPSAGGITKLHFNYLKPYATSQTFTHDFREWVSAWFSYASMELRNIATKLWRVPSLTRSYFHLMNKRHFGWFTNIRLFCANGNKNNCRISNYTHLNTSHNPSRLLYIKLSLQQIKMVAFTLAKAHFIPFRIASGQWKAVKWLNEL